MSKNLLMAGLGSLELKGTGYVKESLCFGIRNRGIPMEKIYLNKIDKPCEEHPYLRELIIIYIYTVYIHIYYIYIYYYILYHICLSCLSMFAPSHRWMFATINAMSDA